jgi:hypothetical protein
MADAMTDTERATHRSPWGWAGVLVGPIAWMAQLLLSWAVGEILACGRAVVDPGRVLGIDANAVVAIMNAVLLALTAVAGIGSLVELRAIRRSDPTPGGRATWLATAGVMTSVLFVVLIATSFVPVALIEGCW